MTLHLFVVVVAMVMLGLAMVKCPELPHWSFGWTGMFLWLLAITVKL